TPTDAIRGRAETGDRRHILGAGARTALLAATAQHRRNPGVEVARDQCTRTLRSTELMRRYGYKVGTARLKAERDAAHYLHRITVEYAIGGVNKIGDAPKRLNHAGLIVGRHDRNECAPACLAVSREHRLERGEVHQAVAIDRNEFDLFGGE